MPRNIDALNAHADKALAAIERRKQPRPVLQLPTVYLTNEGKSWPGCEARNERAWNMAAATGINPKVYLDTGPDEDGCEP